MVGRSLLSDFEAIWREVNGPIRFQENHPTSLFCCGVRVPCGGRRSALRRARLSMCNSRRLRTRVLRCMPSYSGGFALIPVDISENDKNKLLFEFFQRLVIQDACPVHSAHQSLKLRLCGIRMFSTHVQPGEALASLRDEICRSLCGAG